MKLQKCLGKKISRGPDLEYMKRPRAWFSLLVCDLYIHLFAEPVSRRKRLALLVLLCLEGWSCWIRFSYQLQKRKSTVARSECGVLSGAEFCSEWKPWSRVMGRSEKLPGKKCCEFRCKTFTADSSYSESRRVFCEWGDQLLLFALQGCV